MNFWSKHPLDGEMPLEAKEMLEELIFNEDELDDYLFVDEEIYRERLLERMNDAIQFSYPFNQSFVLPFLIARLEMRIEDVELANKVKSMIGDGGAAMRGHSCLQAVGKQYKQHYNNFASPLDYANQLRDMWDALMLGEAEFSQLGSNVDIFDVPVTFHELMKSY